VDDSLLFDKDSANISDAYQEEKEKADYKRKLHGGLPALFVFPSWRFGRVTKGHVDVMCAVVATGVPGACKGCAGHVEGLGAPVGLLLVPLRSCRSRRLAR
jgi:hypothetical protein